MDIKSRGIERIICLGDVVGYGANPAECADIAMGFDVCLVGNHEWAVLNEPIGFNPAARKAVEYTKRLLKPGLFAGAQVKKRWEFIKSLPDRHEEGDYLFVHGSPTNPVEEYLLITDVDPVLGEYTKKIQLAFDKTDFVTLVGHTHTPGIITTDAEFISPENIEGFFIFQKGKKYLANVGSVGQPRDKDWRSSYAVLDRDANTLEYVRLEYNVSLAMKKISEQSELDERLSSRLANGT